MATLNGAEALNMDKKIGSFEKSKLPGIVLLKNLGQNGLQLTQATTVHRII